MQTFNFRLQAIKKTSEYYLTKGITHEPGFKFAINIDPVLFQVFAANETGTARNLNLNLKKNGEPLVSILSATTSPNQILLLSFSNETDGSSYFQFLSFTELFGSVSQSVPIPTSLLDPSSQNQTRTQISSCFWNQTTSLVLLSYHSGFYQLFFADLLPPFSLSFIASGINLSSSLFPSVLFTND